MVRRLLLLTAGCLLPGCLDDRVDATEHFLRSATNTRDEEPSTPETPASGDGGTGINPGEINPGKINPGKTVELGESKSFLAVDRDFEEFQSWTSFDLGNGSHVVDQTGHKQVYINALPKPGDTEFRVGTMIVKVLELGEDPSTWQVHAMVKRGGSYNTQGAFGWEYFDFTLDDRGIPHQNWRGETAPDGESYQTTVFTADGEVLQDVADCNQCHQTASNDAVNTPALNLDLW